MSTRRLLLVPQLVLAAIWLAGCGFNIPSSPPEDEESPYWMDWGLTDQQMAARGTDRTRAFIKYDGEIRRLHMARIDTVWHARNRYGLWEPALQEIYANVDTSVADYALVDARLVEVRSMGAGTQIHVYAWGDICADVWCGDSVAVAAFPSIISRLTCVLPEANRVNVYPSRHGIDPPFLPIVRAPFLGEPIFP